MTGSDARRASSHIGALTNKDHYREAALQKKINDSYRNMSSISSARQRRRQLRVAHRHERALLAQRQRPHSAIVAFAFVLFGMLGVVALTGASSQIALILGALLLVDLIVLRHRRRVLRRL
jgi:Flp pilus assembly protein TadB